MFTRMHAHALSMQEVASAESGGLDLVFAGSRGRCKIAANFTACCRMLTPAGHAQACTPHTTHMLSLTVLPYLAHFHPVCCPCLSARLFVSRFAARHQGGPAEASKRGNSPQQGSSEAAGGGAGEGGASHAASGVKRSVEWRDLGTSLDSDQYCECEMRLLAACARARVDAHVHPYAHARSLSRSPLPSEIRMQTRQ